MPVREAYLQLRKPSRFNSQNSSLICVAKMENKAFSVTREQLKEPSNSTAVITAVAQDWPTDRHHTARAGKQCGCD